MELLHQNKELFIDIVDHCFVFYKKQGLNIDRQSVEKDYWVSYMLSKFARTDYSNKIVFGGGTALMKAHHLIDRFSEDLDFCALNDDVSSTQKQKDCFKAFDTLREIVETTEELNIDEAQYKKTKAHCIMGVNYSKISDRLNYLKQHLEIEVLITPQRYISDKTELKPVYSMMAEYLHKINRNDLIRKFDLTPEKLQVVKPQYTLSDKIIRLAQLGFADDYITEISSCIRDIFDITKLLKNKRFLDFLKTDDFVDFCKDKIIDDSVRYPEITALDFEQSNLFQKTPAIINSQSFTDAKFLCENLLFRANSFPSNKEIVEKFDNIKQVIKKVNL